MPPDRPVRLTFPAFEMGGCRIMADGVKVGIAREDWRKRKWTAYLYAQAGRRGEGFVEEVTRKRLRDLRAELRERLADGGPWWTAG